MNLNITIPEEQAELILRFEQTAEKIAGLMNGVVWLDEKEAGDRLKVDRQTIARWRKEGFLRYIKEPGANGRVRYRADWLDQDVADRFMVKRLV